jgi:Trypsin-co-occurring domain 1
VDTELVRFTLERGGSVLVEVEGDEPGIQRASRVDDIIVQAKQQLEPAMENIRALATVALERLHGLAQRPDGIEVEFGVRLNAQVGAVIARTQADGHLKVKLAWNPPPDRPDA